MEYRRRVYQTTLEDGCKAHVYLLDKAMQMDKIGLISTNLAEKIAMTVTESPYRVTADIISSTCGQSISAGGVWLNMQDEHHKKMKKQEMKVFTMYEGWDAEKEKQGRSTLVEKTMLAGIQSRKRESYIKGWEYRKRRTLQ